MEELRVPSGVPDERQVGLWLRTARSHSPVAYLVHRLLYFAGLRSSEVVGLCRGDLCDSVLFIRSGKGDRDRYVLVDSVTARLFERYADQLDHSREWVRRRVHEAVEACGLLQEYAALGLRLSPHSLRHCFATHRYEAGMQLALVSHLLGHVLVEDTLTYVRTARRQLVSAHARCNPFAVQRGQVGEVPAPAPIVSEGGSQERCREFAFQPTAMASTGLPVAPSAEEVMRLLRQAESRPEMALFFRALYASGWWPEVLCKWSPVQGWPRVDGETRRRLQQCGGFSLDLEQAELFFQQCCQATGLAQRFGHMGRPLGLPVLRYAFAIHCCERNIDPVSLMALLGHSFYETSEVYMRCANARFLTEYRATTSQQADPDAAD